MSQDGLSRYLATQIDRHVRLCFSADAVRSLRAASVEFIPYADAVQKRRPGVFVPNDHAAAAFPGPVWKVPFNGTELTLWNRLPRPDGHGWTAWPDESTPLWWRHESGALIPSWNMFANLVDALTLREDRECATRDEHARVPVRASARFAQGLTLVPVFNEAVAAIVDAAMGLSRGAGPAGDLAAAVKSPILVLSHDCDLLRGDDAVTQAIRVFRAAKPVTKLRLPDLKQLGFVAANVVHPRRHYRDEARGMVNLESQFGYRSTWYVLNGTGGRFGARSGRRATQEFVTEMAGESVGMHYNYDTFQCASSFGTQKRELEAWLGRGVGTGRAHYLRFDAATTLRFLSENGIWFDETVGWPDHIGYRAGIAGVYDAWDSERGEPLSVIECPLVLMDSNVPADRVASVLTSTLAHLRRVGGLLTVLWHTGSFNNPETPELHGVYADILRACHRAGCPSMLPHELRAARIAGASEATA